jgi:hypothetical protein
LAKTAEAVEAAIAGEAKLDAHKLRADFPIFQQHVHGKPLAYLDSAVTAQKPRQVLDALREFCETSYTNVHRGVYLLAAATERFEGSREKVRAFINAASRLGGRRDPRRASLLSAADGPARRRRHEPGASTSTRSPRRSTPRRGPVQGQEDARKRGEFDAGPQ